MITKDNLKTLLLGLNFEKSGNQYSKQFADSEVTLKVDFDKNQLIYPEDKGLKIHERQTCNFSANENFVVFECVHRLLEKGYKPEHIELEPKWKLGHGASGGRADILVKDNAGNSLLIIECKTAGKEHENAWKDTRHNGGQLLSYVQQAKSTQFICLYSSDLINNKLFYHNQVITVLDNEKLLKEKADSQPLSYKEAQTVEGLYRAWSETYNKDYATKGIFEDDIPAYHIGKQKFSLNDLQTISSKDIQGKYHQFATILRQHNVSGRENAFDKLVNLFLCKIVDESLNPNELKFYWKGIAYDSSFDLQDRLQLLYQSGMKEFLGEDVTYIDNTAIDEAFRLFKNDPDATRDTIKKYFRELKFFTNNDFAFIDVHNERLFYQNAAVLLKIVLMLQDIRLKTDEQNQFLGDMFEGFLDQGIKQSEGQFFTPMPIVKFILSSLPLEHLIIAHEQPPKVIDYACGAGHFLNEYAMQIKPFVEQHKTLPLGDYHSAIIGIEKEYRLSKVAKVSAFMYGQDNVQITYNDALVENPKIKDNSYSLLVANPPYSVKGFLETLSATDRSQFELTDSIDGKNYANNNSIEAFFIERAKQLLKADGIAAIIMPSSILSKGTSKISAKKTNVYVAAREILLKHFDIVAIAEFGSGTFGKTGTNTVTLFLRRRKQNPALADHYHNRLESWFNGDDNKDSIFADEHFIHEYCKHLGFEPDHYKTLLQGNPSNNLLSTELFTEYRKEFDNLAETKNRIKQKTFKALSKEEQHAELDKKFLAFVQSIEKDKLYYFVLASFNPSETLIVRSPSGNAEIKKFLGYDWSTAKGNEGIKYLGGQSVTVEKDEEGEEALEQDDKRVLENLLNLNSIQTPLYDSQNLLNSSKINSLIRANFNGETVIVPEALQDFVSKVRLVDLLDFSRKDFDKHVSLSVKKDVNIESKWDLVKLGDVCTFEYGKPLPEDKRINGEYPVMGSNGRVGFHNECLIKGPSIIVGRKGSAGKVIWENIDCFPIDTTFYILPRNNNVILSYLFLTLQNLKLDKLGGGTGVPGLNRNDAYQLKIPLPPLEIQTQIVQACEAVDAEVVAAQASIEHTAQKLEALKTDVFSKGFTEKRLADCALINPSKTEIKQVDENSLVSFVEMASVSETGFIAYKEDRLLKDLKKGSYTYFRENDIIIAKITPCMENGKCAFATGLTNGLAMGSSEFHVIRTNEEIVLGQYIFALLNRDSVRKEAEKNMTGSSGHRRVPASFYADYRIPVPDLTTQQQLITEIVAHEANIAAAQAIIDAAASKKQAILKQYL